MRINQSHPAMGYAYGLGAALLYGTTATIGKYTLITTDAFTVAALGYFIGSVVFIPAKRVGPLEKGVLKLVFLAGIFGSVIAPLLYFTGLSMTAATNAALLSNGEAIFTSIIAVMIFKESMSKYQVAAAATVLFGVALVSSVPGESIGSLLSASSFRGNLLIICATFAWGIDNNISRVATKVLDPTILTKYKNMIGASCLLVASLLAGSFHIPTEAALPGIVGIGVMGVGLSTAFLMHSLKKLGAVRAVMLFSTSSIFGLAFAHIFLAEAITAVQVVGMVLMVAGLYIMNILSVNLKNV